MRGCSFHWYGALCGSGSRRMSLPAFSGSCVYVAMAFIYPSRVVFITFVFLYVFPSARSARYMTAISVWVASSYELRVMSMSSCLRNRMKWPVLVQSVPILFR